MKELLDEGKIRLVGISNATIEQIDIARKILGEQNLASVQNQFSPACTLARLLLPGLRAFPAISAYIRVSAFYIPLQPVCPTHPWWENLTEERSLTRDTNFTWAAERAHVSQSVFHLT